MTAADSIPNTLGLMFLGLVFALILYGINLVQMYAYYDRYWADRLWLKLYVLLVFILDTVNMAFVIYLLWYYVVDQFGQSSLTTHLEWSFPAQIMAATSAIFFVQLFYAWRVWKLTKSIVITTLIALFATIDLGLGLYQGVLLFQQPTFEAIVDKVGLNDAGLATSMIADVIIASAMVFALRSKRSDMPRTKSIMSRLITFAIGTSLLTTVFNAVLVILRSSSAVPANAANLVYFMLPRLYTNAFLVNLNARHRTSNLLNQAQHMTPPSMQLESLQRRHTARTSHGNVRTEDPTVAATESSKYVVEAPPTIRSHTERQRIINLPEDIFSHTTTGRAVSHDWPDEPAHGKEMHVV